MRLWITLGLAITLSVHAQSQSSAEAEFAQAMRLIGEGNFDQAELKLRAIERAYPSLFEVRYRLGLVLLRQGKHKEASARIEAAVQQSPTSAPAWLAAAQVRMKLGQRQGALLAAKRAAALAPREIAITRALARFYAEAGEFAAALALEDRLGSSPELLAEFHRAMGQSYRAARRPAEAVDSLQEAVRLMPEDWRAYAALAGLFLDHRTPEPVVVLLESAPKPLRQIAEFHRILGLAYYQTGKRNRAMDEFLAAADLEPDAEVGYTSLETLLPDADARRGELLRRFERLRINQPRNPVGHFLLARGKALGGAPAAEVEPLLRRALEVEPSFWPAYYELGILLEAGGDAADSATMLERCVKLNGEYAAAHFALSRVYSKQGNRALAVVHRKRHAELLENERARAAKAREESPALNYRLDSGAGIAAPEKDR